MIPTTSSSRPFRCHSTDHWPGQLYPLRFDVRLYPKSGHWNSVAECPLCAKSGLYLVRHSILTLNDDKISDRAVQSKSNYFLVLRRSVPSFSSFSRREFDYHETRVRPFPFQ